MKNLRECGISKIFKSFWNFYAAQKHYNFLNSSKHKRFYKIFKKSQKFYESENLWNIKILQIFEKCGNVRIVVHFSLSDLALGSRDLSYAFVHFLVIHCILLNITQCLIFTAEFGDHDQEKHTLDFIEDFILLPQVKFVWILKRWTTQCGLNCRNIFGLLKWMRP